MGRKPRTGSRGAQRAAGGVGNIEPGAKGSDDGASEQINGHDSFDPAALAGQSDAGSNDGDGADGSTGERKPRADRGRPRGPRKNAPLDLSDLKDIIVMVHAGIAVAFQAPTLSLDDVEGDKLAGAVQKVLRHYDLPDVASETKDWIGLIITAGAIYGPRMAAYWATKNTPPPPPTREQADNNVVTLTHGTVGGLNHPGPGLG